MKSKLLTIIFLYIVNILSAQDSIKVETVLDTFVTPQYVGEFDYLFMKHEAKSDMWKVDFPLISTKPFARVAFEKRLVKGVSFELSTGLHDFDHFSISNGKITSVLGIAGEFRWYIFKKNQIDKKLTNNNLEGFYMGGGYEKLINFDPNYQELPNSSSKIAKDLLFGKLGFQKRFLNNKYIDFGLTLGSKKYHWDSFLNYDVNEFDMQWRGKLGWLINGSKKGENCAVLRCFEEPKQLFKIDLLNVIKEFYANYKHFNPSVAYEHKIGNSQFSVNANATYDFEQIKYISALTGSNEPRVEAYSKDRTVQYCIGIEPRWYFLMKRRIARGKQANNLNGLYLASNINYFNRKREIITDKKEAEKFPSHQFEDEIKERKIRLRYGLAIGYQQALSNNLFYEARFEYYNTGVFDETPSALNFKLGLAF